MELTSIYEHTKVKNIAFTKMARWFNKVDESEFDSFKMIKRTFHKHYQYILNYFDRRTTNASGESFNAKIKKKHKIDLIDQVTEKETFRLGADIKKAALK